MKDVSQARMARNAASADLSGVLPAFAELEVLHSKHVRVHFRKSHVKRLVLELHELEDGCSVQLHSDTLPHPLVKKLQRVASAAVSDGPAAVVRVLADTFSHNLLLSCWDEIKEIKTLGSGVSLRMNEKKGVLRVKFSCRSAVAQQTDVPYTATLCITIPDTYPQAIPQFELRSTSFPDRMLRRVRLECVKLVTQRGEGVRDPLGLAGGGMTEEERSHLVELLKAGVAGIDSTQLPQAVTANALLDLKGEVRYLQRASQLREQLDEKDKRRLLVRLRKKAATAAEEEDALVEEKHAKEIQEALDIARGRGVTALPSVGLLVFFVHRNLVSVALAECQVCSKPLLPATPSKLAALEKRVTSKRTPRRLPERAHCGHWFHHGCLDSWLTSPPFVRECEQCGRRVSHPKWNDNVAELEREWAQKKAKQGELDLIQEFIGI